MQIKAITAIFFFFLFASTLKAQDRSYVHKTVSKLASPQMHGRGYFKDGDIKAAKFIAAELKKAGLEPLWDDFYQPYTFNINTFPGKVNLKIDKELLRPGSDFVVHPAQAPINKTFELIWLPDTLTKQESVYLLVDTTALDGKMLVVPAELKEAYRYGIKGVPALIQLENNNIWWHVSRTQLEKGHTRIKILAEKLNKNSKTLSLEVQSEILTERVTYNIGGFIPGKNLTDSTIIFVAHYDHLGRMGKKALFPGASDNASGTVTVLDLARYYAKNPEQVHYRMIFLLVSGEEAGLLGSSYFADNPPFPLSKTRFVINFDMVGTGSEGLAIVNGKVIPSAFEVFAKLNKENSHFPQLRQGNHSCNSDHCPFFNKGVPAVFLYTFGPENRNYHNIYDVAAQLPFTAYEKLFTLVVSFVNEIPLHPSFQIEN